MSSVFEWKLIPGGAFFLFCLLGPVPSWRKLLYPRGLHQYRRTRLKKADPQKGNHIYMRRGSVDAGNNKGPLFVLLASATLILLAASPVSGIDTTDE